MAITASFISADATNLILEVSHIPYAPPKNLFFWLRFMDYDQGFSIVKTNTAGLESSLSISDLYSNWLVFNYGTYKYYAEIEGVGVSNIVTFDITQIESGLPAIKAQNPDPINNAINQPRNIINFSWTI
jgi:hypothetical protein